MEPTNNPIPTPNPTPGPIPTPSPTSTPNPIPTGGSVTTPDLASVSGTASASGSTLATDVMGAPNNTNGVQSPDATSVSAPAPVQGMAAGAASAGQSDLPPIQPPINPVVKPTGMGVTDPILMPDKPAEPDPVEEELKAPMKAAAPVPGSIGSAVSGPGSVAGVTASVPAENPFTNNTDRPTPNVSFTDPAEQNTQATPTDSKQPAKKNNRVTLIALIVVAAIIVIVLIVVLAMQLGGSGGPSKPNATNGGNNTANVDDKEKESPSGGDVDDETNGETNGESSETQTVVATSVACSSTVTGEDGNTTLTDIQFDFEDKLLVGASVNVSVSDSEGQILGKQSTQMPFESIVGDNTIPEGSEYLTADGTLLVSFDEFTARLEESLNSGGAGTYTCGVI